MATPPTAALDAAWDNPDSKPTLNGAKGRKCYRHRWDYWHPVEAPDTLEMRCLLCGAVRDPIRTRTNRNNRKRGNRTSHDLAAYLGGRNVEALKEPWDVEAAGARIQSKRLAARPSVAAIVGLIERIEVPADRVRALFWVGAGQRITSGHVFLLLREWVAEHGWMGPSGASFLASGEIVIELPVAVFREMRGGSQP